MKLYVIIDTSVQSRFSHLELAKMAIAGGADLIQLREKKMKSGEILRVAMEMSRLCGQSGVKFIVNDRVDIALLSDADGVHLGKEDFPIKAAREILKGKMIGVTAHTLEEALAAESEGADYIGFGHIFPTDSKNKPTAPVGVNALLQVCARVKIPVYAIGGISGDNVKEVMEAGPSGVAVIGAVCAARDPSFAARRLKEQLAPRLAPHI